MALKINVLWRGEEQAVMSRAMQLLLLPGAVMLKLGDLSEARGAGMVAAMGIPSSSMSLWSWWMINQCQGTGPFCGAAQAPMDQRRL